MIGIIIQARMGSNRLPGKVLKEIGDKPLLEHILCRLKKLQIPAKTIVATSTLKQDDAIEEFCKKHNTQVFRGSEENVLERYYECATLNAFKHIIRLTADNPFVDIEKLDELIKLHIDTNADYSKSFEVLPKGVGAEVFTFDALETSYLKSTQPHHFEHVNEYILENPQLFKTSTLNKKGFNPEISLTVDTIEDYKKACYIVNNSKKEIITTKEAIELSLKYEDTIK